MESKQTKDIQLHDCLFKIWNYRTLYGGLVCVVRNFAERSLIKS